MAIDNDMGMSPTDGTHLAPWQMRQLLEQPNNMATILRAIQDKQTSVDELLVMLDEHLHGDPPDLFVGQEGHAS